MYLFYSIDEFLNGLFYFDIDNAFRNISVLLLKVSLKSQKSFNETLVSRSKTNLAQWIKHEFIML